LKLGLTEVPVHIAKDLTPDQIKAYRIADNKLAELAEWNMELLPIELGELKAADYDLELLGFDADELAKIFNGDVTEGQCDPDEVPAPPDAAITQLTCGFWAITACSVATPANPRTWTDSSTVRPSIWLIQTRHTM
jgi:hypothetical protein